MITAIRIFLLVLIIIGLGLILARDYWVPPLVDQILDYTGQAKAASYVCRGGQTIVANYYQGPTIPLKSGQPPIPTGVVSIRFNDGRSLTLAQTLSADGVRYANPDESFVFWSKGDEVLVLEEGKEKTYFGCVDYDIFG